MPFVHRDADGVIVAVSRSRDAHCGEEVAADDPALVRFIGALQSDVASQLRSTDQGFIRVLEDVVDLLVEKGVIGLGELPEDAQDKIRQRKELRARLR